MFWLELGWREYKIKGQTTVKLGLSVDEDNVSHNHEGQYIIMWVEDVYNRNSWVQGFCWFFGWADVLVSILFLIKFKTIYLNLKY